MESPTQMDNSTAGAACKVPRNTTQRQVVYDESRRKLLVRRGRRRALKILALQVVCREGYRLNSTSSSSSTDIDSAQGDAATLKCAGANGWQPPLAQCVPSKDGRGADAESLSNFKRVAESLLACMFSLFEMTPNPNNPEYFSQVGPV